MWADPPPGSSFRDGKGLVKALLAPTSSQKGGPSTARVARAARPERRSNKISIMSCYNVPADKQAVLPWLPSLTVFGKSGLVEDTGQMVLHRLFAKGELLGNVSVSVALDYSCDDLQFARG